MISEALGYPSEILPHSPVCKCNQATSELAKIWGDEHHGIDQQRLKLELTESTGLLPDGIDTRYSSITCLKYL